MSYADDVAPVCDPGDPDSCVTYVLKGQQAPFTGQLLSNKRAAVLAVKAGGCSARLKLEIDREQALFQAKLTLEQRLRAIDTQSRDQQIKILQERLEDLSSGPPWYSRPPFVVAVTVVAMSLTLWGSIEAMKAMAPLNN